MSTGRLDEKRIKEYISHDMDVFVHENIDSTSDEIRRMYNAGRRKPVLVTAEQQIKGRGRKGRSFYSPKSTGIYMSMLLFPDMTVEESLKVTSASAVVIAQVLQEYVSEKIYIKWVNDLYYKNRKCSGILTEAVTDFETLRVEALLLGIGINTGTHEFPEGIDAISLGISADLRSEIIGKIAEEISSMLDRKNYASYMNNYVERSILVGRNITYEENGVSCTGLVRGITEEGYLVVRRNGEEILLRSGEISINKDFLN